jgi:hypothetical protein
VLPCAQSVVAGEDLGGGRMQSDSLGEMHLRFGHRGKRTLHGEWQVLRILGHRCDHGRPGATRVDEEQQRRQVAHASARLEHEDPILVARAELLEPVRDVPPTRKPGLLVDVRDGVGEGGRGLGPKGAQPLRERLSKYLLEQHQPTLNASIAM